jgi:hypothetical protein
VQTSSSSPTAPRSALLPENKNDAPTKHTNMVVEGLAHLSRWIVWLRLGKQTPRLRSPLTQVTFPLLFFPIPKRIRIRSNQISQTACFQIQTMIHLRSASDNNQARSSVSCYFLGCAGICQRHHFFYSQLLHTLYPVYRPPSPPTNPPKITQKSVKACCCITPRFDRVPLSNPP